MFSWFFFGDISVSHSLVSVIFMYDVANFFVLSRPNQEEREQRAKASRDVVHVPDFKEKSILGKSIDTPLRLFSAPVSICVRSIDGAFCLNL